MWKLSYWNSFFFSRKTSSPWLQRSFLSTRSAYQKRLRNCWCREWERENWKNKYKLILYLHSTIIREHNIIFIHHIICRYNVHMCECAVEVLFLDKSSQSLFYNKIMYLILNGRPFFFFFLILCIYNRMAGWLTGLAIIWRK